MRSETSPILNYYLTAQFYFGFCPRAQETAMNEGRDGIV
jgi:hypothetical protein